MRKQGGLAESAGGIQHRQPAARRHDPAHKLGTVDIPRHPVGDRDLLAQQPGKRPFDDGYGTRSSRRLGDFTAAGDFVGHQARNSGCIDCTLTGF